MDVLGDGRRGQAGGRERLGEHDMWRTVSNQVERASRLQEGAQSLGPRERDGTLEARMFGGSAQSPQRIPVQQMPSLISGETSWGKRALVKDF